MVAGYPVVISIGLELVALALRYAQVREALQPTMATCRWRARSGLASIRGS